VFRAADLFVLTKTDLAAHVEFDADACAARARSLNPRLQCVRVAAPAGVGLEGFEKWVEAAMVGEARTTAE
jgi:Ni2+-binding GTPase involved in maturation of urease and hydrogenase